MTQSFTEVWEQKPDYRFNTDGKEEIVGGSEYQLCISCM